MAVDRRGRFLRRGKSSPGDSVVVAVGQTVTLVKCVASLQVHTELWCLCNDGDVQQSTPHPESWQLCSCFYQLVKFLSDSVCSLTKINKKKTLLASCLPEQICRQRHLSFQRKIQKLWELITAFIQHNPSCCSCHRFPKKHPWPRNGDWETPWGRKMWSSGES